MPFFCFITYEGTFIVFVVLALYYKYISGLPCYSQKTAELIYSWCHKYNEYDVCLVEAMEGKTVVFNS